MSKDQQVLITCDYYFCPRKDLISLKFTSIASSKYSRERFQKNRGRGRGVGGAGAGGRSVYVSIEVLY